MEEGNNTLQEIAKKGRLLSLGEASRLLGVDETTLRRWADRRELRSVRTPGGHRRFAEEDLSALMRTKEKVPNLGSLDEVALEEARRRIREGKLADSPWYQAFDEEARVRMRLLGRRLHTLVADYITNPDRKALLAEARSLGNEYGSQLAAVKLSLKQVFEAFLFFRDSLVDVAKQVAIDRSLPAEKAMWIQEQVATLMDNFLLSTIETYERSFGAN